MGLRTGRTDLAALLIAVVGLGTIFASAAHAEGTWELTGALNTPRSVHTATLLRDGRVLVAGGRASATGAALGSAELYNPRTGTWTPTGSLANTRFGHTATLLGDGRVLVAGGFTGALLTNAQPVLSTAEIYDPATEAWTPAASLATRRSLHVAVVLSGPVCQGSTPPAFCGKVLVAGGRTCNAAPPATCDFTFVTNSSELYDSGTNTWAPAGAMTVPRHTTAAALLSDGRVLVPGGFQGTSSPSGTAEFYNPGANAWTATAGGLVTARARGNAVRLLDGRVLTLAGFPANNASELFDPATGAFAATGTLATSGRFNFSTALMPTGKVLLFGGVVSGVPAPTAEVYDPAAGTWASGGSPAIARGSSSSLANSSTAVVLSSEPGTFASDPARCGQNCGKVLAVGNSDDPRAELYTPEPPSGPPASGPPASGPPESTPPAVVGIKRFGLDTRVTLTLGKAKVGARGPVEVKVSNQNSFAVSGALSGEIDSIGASASARRRKAKPIKLGPKSFGAGASASATVKLSLPTAARTQLRRKRKLSIRLSATVKDPAGTSRSVKRTLTPKLKAK